jgi:uncharacterized protein (TIGR03382 family)
MTFPTARTLLLGLPLLATVAVRGDFSGPYAPENWMFADEAGGFIDQHTADTLVLVGGDIGLAGETDLTIVAMATGRWSFDWSYTTTNSFNFELAYYLINGTQYQVSGESGDALRGSVAVDVRAGDIIGFGVDTLDGAFGPGIFTITDFSAPVPGPASLALLTALAVQRRRRR